MIRYIQYIKGKRIARILRTTVEFVGTVLTVVVRVADEIRRDAHPVSARELVRATLLEVICSTEMFHIIATF